MSLRYGAHSDTLGASFYTEKMMDIPVSERIVRSQEFFEAMRSGDIELLIEAAGEKPLSHDELDEIFSIARERKMWSSLYKNIAYQFPNYPKDEDEIIFMRSLSYSCITLALAEGDVINAEHSSSLIGRKLSIRQIERCFLNATCTQKNDLAKEALSRLLKRRAGIGYRVR